MEIALELKQANLRILCKQIRELLYIQSVKILLGRM